MDPFSRVARRMLQAAAALLLPGLALAQGADPLYSEYDSEDVVMLPPFEVSAADDVGYRSTQTEAGSRIATDLVDVGSAISVYNKEILTDVGAKDNESLLSYGLGTETRGVRGNYSASTGSGSSEGDLFDNPQSGTRVRGLAKADSTVDFFVTDVGWDSFNVSRIDLQRGPNAILFGLGSPAGIINATRVSALPENFGEAQTTFDGEGGLRGEVDLNRALLDEQLMLRFAAVQESERFPQKQAYDDQERYYLTSTYAPKTLNRNGRTFKVSVGVETGNINSSQPRLLAPQDRLSPWWNESVNQMTVDYLKPAGQLPHEQDTAAADWLALDFSTGPRFIRGGTSLGLAPDQAILVSKTNIGALRPDGTVNTDPNAGELIYLGGPNPYTLKNYEAYHRDLGVNGIFARGQINDTGVFDFYRNLIDGDTKREWSDFDLYDANATATFFRNRLAFDFAAFQQNAQRGQSSLLGWQPAVDIDLNERLPDGSPNPNVGRAYVAANDADSRSVARIIDQDRKAWRFQGVAQHDFLEFGDQWYWKALGLHRITALMSRESYEEHNRNLNYFGVPGLNEIQGTSNIYDGKTRPNVQFYVSDDLRGLDSPSGAHLAPVSLGGAPLPVGTANLRIWDNTWVAGADVIPGDPWANPDDPARAYTQSNNPANYRGWTWRQFPFVYGLSGNPDDLAIATEDVKLQETRTDSRVFVWQGHLINRAIVGTVGYREDEQTSRILTRRRPPEETNLFTTPVKFPEAGENPGPTDIYNQFKVDGESTNWSVAVHLHRLVGDWWEKHIPLNVSLYYNSGENFAPESSRIDAFGRQFPSPKGTTTDKSLLLATPDNKYSLRVTQYETRIENATSSAGLGQVFTFAQLLEEGARQSQRFLTGYYDTNGVPGAVRRGNSLKDKTNWRGDPYNADEFMNVVIPAWLAFEKDFQEAFPQFVDAWLIGGGWNPGTVSTDFENNGPAGFKAVEDSLSEGYEFEFVANPVRGWSILLNASKTEAVRKNVGGTAFLDVLTYTIEHLKDSPAGDVPAFTFGAPGLSRHNRFVSTQRILNDLKVLDGVSQPEIPEWKVNVLTRYQFFRGWLKGFGFGGGARYTDSYTIDYRRDFSGELPTILLDQPIEADSYTAIDLLAFYKFKVFKDINAEIRLNVFNVFGEDELVPLDVNQVDGQIIGPGNYRICYGPSWQMAFKVNF